HPEVDQAAGERAEWAMRIARPRHGSRAARTAWRARGGASIGSHARILSTCRRDCQPRVTRGGGAVDIAEALGYSPTVFRLLPREEKFFDLFEQQGANIVAAARALETLTLDYPNAKTHAQAIEDLEHAGDTLTHELVRRLNTTFITPIDREDIYAL